MQCDTAPWDAAYQAGNITFVKQPTDDELITGYYSTLGIAVHDVRRVNETGVMQCQACHVCAKGYYFTASVVNADLPKMPGWKPFQP